MRLISFSNMTHAAVSSEAAPSIETDEPCDGEPAAEIEIPTCGRRVHSIGHLHYTSNLMCTTLINYTTPKTVGTAHGLSCMKVSANELPYKLFLTSFIVWD